MTVGLPEEGKIVEFYQVGNDRLLTIKERATYEIQLADRIDPDQTNKNIPHVQQRIFDAGTESEIVQGILLQSKILLNPTILKEVDVHRALQCAIDATGEILAMSRIADRVAAEENSLLESLVGKKLETGFIVPTLHDAAQDMKNFLSRADHFVKELQNISRLIHGRFRKWEDIIDNQARSDDLPPEEIEPLQKMVRYIRFLREARNSSEHPHEKKRIQIQNFRILPNGDLATPTVEVVHPKYPEPEVDIPVFYKATIESLLNVYGSWIARLCIKRASMPGFDLAVINTPPAKRTYKRAAFSYAVRIGNEWRPLG